MVGFADAVWLPAAVAFLAVALGSVALVLIWDRLQEQHRKRRMLGELRHLVNEAPEGSERGSWSAVSLDSRGFGRSLRGCRRSRTRS